MKCHVQKHGFSGRSKSVFIEGKFYYAVGKRSSEKRESQDLVAQISQQPSIIAENATGFDIFSPASCGNCTLRVTSGSTNNIISVDVIERGTMLYSEGDLLEVTKAELTSAGDNTIDPKPGHKA